MGLCQGPLPVLLLVPPASQPQERVSLGHRTGFRCHEIVRFHSAIWREETELVVLRLRAAQLFCEENYIETTRNNMFNNSALTSFFINYIIRIFVLRITVAERDVMKTNNSKLSKEYDCC